MPKENEDDKTGSGTDEDLKVQLKQATDAITLLANNQKTMQDSMIAIQDSIKTLGEVSQQHLQSQQQGDEEDDDPLADTELENLDRKGFMDLILSSLDKKLNSFGKGLEEKIGSVQTHVETNDLKSELDAAVNAHKDFPEWANEVKTLIQESPGLSLERAYKLAREENPDKVKEMDEKYADKDTSTDGNKGNKSTGFGGLTPNSGVQTDKPTDMSPEEAAEAAWSETMDGLDELAAGS